MNFNSCSELETFCEENNSRFEIFNRSNADIVRYKVDGCLITNAKQFDGIKRCDYFFEVNIPSNSSNTKVLYVELKGGDLKYAARQISSTANYSSIKTRHSGIKKEGFVATPPLPPHFTTENQQIEADFFSENKFFIYFQNSIEV